MSHTPLPDASFYEILLQIDLDTASALHATGCRYCGDRLDRAYYLRQPRLVPDNVGEAFNVMFSFCCRREGCRKRHCAPSVRFFGRKVYLLFVMLKVCKDAGRPPKKSLAMSAKHWGVSGQSIKRWYDFWHSQFPKSSFWLSRSGLLLPPIGSASFVSSIIDRFDCRDDCPEKWSKILRFLTSSLPLS